MKFKHQLIGIVTGCLLMGASNVMAIDRNLFVDIYRIDGVQASDDVIEDLQEQNIDRTDFCIEGIDALRGLGFRLRQTLDVSPRRNGYVFQRFDGSAILFCALAIFEFTP